MPCVLGGDAEIPIARYGSSNIGRMKHVYRVGLGLRYGRVMQAISGVHFNYSFPERLWPSSRHRRSQVGGQPSSTNHFALLVTLAGWCCICSASPGRVHSFSPGRDIDPRAPGPDVAGPHARRCG
jgi:glutamate--cysteine ligase